MTSRGRLDLAMRCQRPDRVPASIPVLPAEAPATPEQRARFEQAEQAELVGRDALHYGGELMLMSVRMQGFLRVSRRAPRDL